MSIGKNGIAKKLKEKSQIKMFYSAIKELKAVNGFTMLAVHHNVIIIDGIKESICTRAAYTYHSNIYYTQ